MRDAGRARSGFTMVELLVVISVISILASIAVPSFVRGRASANEGAIVGTLRSLAKAQFQFKALNLVDSDGDGGAEYGTLGEITGREYLRGTVEKLAPRLMSESLGALSPAGQVLRHGYLIALYLPDPSGMGLAETPANASNIGAILAQDYWTCVAWPLHEHSGEWTYFVNQQGQLLKSRGGYEAAGNPPPAGCALMGVAPTHVNTQALAVHAVGADGNTWVPVN